MAFFIDTAVKTSNLTIDDLAKQKKKWLPPPSAAAN
jgi:hypothetical protein